MPKMKTKKSAAKRFKVTGKGVIKRARATKRHILTKRTKKIKGSCVEWLKWLRVMHAVPVDDALCVIIIRRF